MGRRQSILAARKHDRHLLAREVELLELTGQTESPAELFARERERLARVLQHPLIAPDTASTLTSIAARVSGAPEPRAVAAAHLDALFAVEAEAAPSWRAFLAAKGQAAGAPHAETIAACHASKDETLLSWRSAIEELRVRTHFVGQLGARLARIEEELEEASRDEEAKIEEDARASEAAVDDGDDGYEVEDVVEIGEPSQPAEPGASEAHRQDSRPLPKPVAGASEHRAHPRLPLAEPIHIGRDQHAFFTGFVENISTGGLFVASFDLEPEIGDIFMVRFVMPDGTSITATGEVTWTRAYNIGTPELSPGAGLRFCDLRAEDQSRIGHYIAKEGSLFFG